MKILMRYMKAKHEITLVLCGLAIVLKVLLILTFLTPGAVRFGG